MRNSNTLPFRSLRDLVLKELQQDKSLLTWNNDASFTHNTLATLLASEAYLLDRSAVEYLGDLAQGLTIEDYYRSIAQVVSRMWWKLPSSGLRACNDGSSQAARSMDIGSRGWDRVSQPSTFRIWI